MNESEMLSQPLNGTKKRRMMPHELFGRFSSKSDFIKYFRESRKSQYLSLILSVQFNCIFLQNIWWTKTSWRRYSSTKSASWSSMRSREYVSLSMMSYLSSNCGRWWEMTKSSCDSSLQRCPRAESLIENISSIFWTLSKGNIFSNWSLIPRINATKLREKPKHERQSRSLRIGGNNSRVFLSSLVSDINSIFFCSCFIDLFIISLLKCRT